MVLFITHPLRRRPMRHTFSMKLRWALFFFLSVFGMTIGHAEDPKRADNTVPRIHIDLTESFYRALQNESTGGDRIYSNMSKSEEYLRQIAISAKFMVETNIQIIKQQERMIELLEVSSGKRGR